MKPVLLKPYVCRVELALLCHSPFSTGNETADKSWSDGELPHPHVTPWFTNPSPCLSIFFFCFRLAIIYQTW